MTLIGNMYRWLYGRFRNKPTNFSWAIPGELAGSGLPMTHDEFKWIINQGIKSIVSVREVPLPARWLDKENDLDYMHLEVEDYGTPSIEDLSQIVSHIAEQIMTKRPVVVHCAAGRGRTGEVLAAYLMMSEQLTAKDAIAVLRKIRPGSVQSLSQEKALEAYEKYLLENPHLRLSASFSSSK
jgi:atypical dual specificity phosphatase